MYLKKVNQEFKNNIRYRQCSVSVMDTCADPDIRFDEMGICNYYYEFQKSVNEKVFKGDAGKQKLQSIFDKIKHTGRNQDYDCIMGLSGGVDSTYVAYLAKLHGLRPLAVHFDNGWNSELAIKNIENIVNKLDIDLFTYVIDWEEFRDLQIAYLKASVVDIEIITDHAISSVLYRLAGERNIKYILSGTNVYTENTLPPSWIFAKTDHVNIKAIHKAFGKIRLKTYPFMTFKVKRYYQQIKGIESLSILNYVDYKKESVKNLIQHELGWRDYGGKHHESIWTRFFQGYILPVKFKIDKRKAHLSDLIFSGQITKETALAELDKIMYDDEKFKIDYDFVLKKLGLTNEEFNDILELPIKNHKDYDYEKPLDKKYPLLKPIKYLFRKLFPVRL